MLVTLLRKKYIMTYWEYNINNIIYLSLIYVCKYFKFYMHKKNYNFYYN